MGRTRPFFAIVRGGDLRRGVSGGSRRGVWRVGETGGGGARPPFGSTANGCSSGTSAALAERPHAASAGSSIYNTDRGTEGGTAQFRNSQAHGKVREATERLYKPKETRQVQPGQRQS